MSGGKLGSFLISDTATSICVCALHACLIVHYLVCTMCGISYSVASFEFCRVYCVGVVHGACSFRYIHV